MRPHLIPEALAGCLGLVLASSLALTAWPSFATADTDALQRPEFDREITLRMQDVDIVAVFRAIGGLAHVPFLLELDGDATLRVTLDAINMVCRGILESLANTYGLEYSTADGAVVVRRRGLSSATARIAVGPKPATASVVHYWFDLAVRDRQGSVRPLRRIERPFHVFEPLVFSVTGQPDTMIPTLNPKRGILEPRNVGAFQLTIGVTTDRGDTVELAAELVTRRIVDRTRYLETHVLAMPAASAREQVLFTTDGGYAIVLTAWGRMNH